VTHPGHAGLTVVTHRNRRGEFRPVLEMLVTLPSGGAAPLAASAACPLLI
jgi:hypothetical protein